MPRPWGMIDVRPSRPIFITMINRINNTICFLVVAAVFAMIGIEAGIQPGMTHSGTQIEIRK
jgi:hypothetical protein